jgi:hypothetical protein
MLRKGLIRGAVNVPLSTVSKGRMMECEGREGEKIGVWFLVACGEKWRGFCRNGSGKEVGGYFGLRVLGWDGTRGLFGRTVLMHPSIFLKTFNVIFLKKFFLFDLC